MSYIRHQIGSRVYIHSLACSLVQYVWFRSLVVRTSDFDTDLPITGVRSPAKPVYLEFETPWLLFSFWRFAPGIMIPHALKCWSGSFRGATRYFCLLNTFEKFSRVGLWEMGSPPGRLVKHRLTDSQSSQGNNGEKSSPTGHIVPS